ncbi:MAG: dihydropteroate synthase [Bacteroidota bacterium]
MLKSRVEDINFYSKRTIRVGEKLLDLSSPKVMGIINCTPDSFYKASRFSSVSAVLEEAARQLEAGADMLDIGGYSSRPGAENISEEEEKQRIIPVIEAIRAQFPQALISVDTFRGKVADEAMQAGANIINDIGAFDLDPGMLETLEKWRCPYILMHMRGTPQTMQQNTQYNSLFKEMCYFFSEKIARLHAIGIYDIILDPGFGFAKTQEQNYDILEHLDDFRFLNQPILVGVSRKSMISKKTGSDSGLALNGTTVLNTVSLLKQASVIRVHDVREAREILQLIN